jgi:hypothetical protein
MEVKIHAFLTSIPDGSGRRHAPAALFPGKDPLVLTGYEAEPDQLVVWIR